MLIGGVIQHHFDDDADSPVVGGLEDLPKILQGSVAGMYGVVIGNVVAIVAQRRGKKRHEPDRIDAQFLQVAELLFEPLKIADAIAVAVVESAYVLLDR